jgi:NAD(P)-dependent dehydrogenase (short-subunit alcohol dehydrogenase family)
MFHGKSVLVTGSARNTGSGIAKVFGNYGATVFVHGRSAEQVAHLVQMLNHDSGEAGGRYLPVAADVVCEDDVARAFAFIEQQVGGLDVLVNNACHLGLGYRFLDMPIGFFDEVLAGESARLRAVRPVCRPADGRPRRRGRLSTSDRTRPDVPYAIARPISLPRAAWRA